MEYALTAHATVRISERQITADELACALGRGRIYLSKHGGIARFWDRLTGVVAVVDVWFRRIVTAYRV